MGLTTLPRIVSIMTWTWKTAWMMPRILVATLGNSAVRLAADIYRQANPKSLPVAAADMEHDRRRGRQHAGIANLYDGGGVFLQQKIEAVLLASVE